MVDNEQNSSGAGQSSNALRRRINRQAVDEEGYIYKECRRNVSILAGRYTVDGCTEFLREADGTETDMLCLACGCHRSFHRKVISPADHLRRAAAHYFLLNDVRNFLRPMQPRPQPQQAPRPLVPQPQTPRPLVPQPQQQGLPPQPPRPLVPVPQPQPPGFPHQPPRPLMPMPQQQPQQQAPQLPPPLMPQPAEIPRQVQTVAENYESNEEEEEEEDEDDSEAYMSEIDSETEDDEVDLNKRSTS